MEIELQPGDCLADRYIILEEIGRGGFGVVYRAVQEGVNRHVALKTIRKQVSKVHGFDFVEAFRREALLTSKLKHPNTITLFDYGETNDGLLYLVTEFLDGETLYERLWREREMSPDTAIHIAKQIAKSLGEAHSNGIIHGDLKPANIFLCQMYGEQDFVKVLDFGIAKIIGEVDPAGMGTPEYMSPEQFSGQPLQAASDVYSVGCIIYEMLIGTRPFEDKDTQKLARRHLAEPLPQMPPVLEESPLGQIIRKATNKEPFQRFEDGMELFKALVGLTASLSPPSTSSLRARSAPASSRPVPVQSSPHPSLFQGSLATIPITGRESERHWLLNRHESVIEKEEGKLVLVGGAAGVGKTILGHWLLDKARQSGSMTGMGDFRQNSPHRMEALADAIAEAVGFPRQTGLDHATARIEQALGETLERPLTTPELRALSNLYDIEEEDFVAQDLAGLIVSVAQSRPMVLLINDMRWADAPSLEVLGAIADLVDDTPAQLFLMVAMRRGALATSQALGEFTTRLVSSHSCVVPLTVGALNPVDTFYFTELAFLAALENSDLKKSPPSPQLVRRVASRCCGNPLYTQHLIRYLIKHEKLSSNGHVLHLSGVTLSETMPTSIGHLVHLRIRHLNNLKDTDPELLQFLLMRVVLIGQEVARVLLLNTLQRGAQRSDPMAVLAIAKLDHLLEILQREDIIFAADDFDREGNRLKTYRFSNPMLYQVLQINLGELPESRHLHRDAAIALQRHHSAGQKLDAHVEEIGLHFKKAGDPREAVRFLLKAARHQCMDGDLNSAAELLEQCRSLCSNLDEFFNSRIRIIIALSYLKLLLSAFADFEALQVLGMRLAEKLGATEAINEFTLQAGIMALGAGRIKQAESLLEKASVGFEEQRSHTPNSLTREEEDLSLLNLFLSMNPLHPTIGLATSIMYRGIAQREMCKLHNADRFLQRAGQLYRTSNHHWGMSMCRMELGKVSTRRGQPESSLTLFRSAAAVFTKMNASHETFLVNLSEAETLIKRWELGQARELLVDTLTAHRDSRSPLSTRCRATLAKILNVIGRREEAREEFKIALERSRIHGARLTLLQNLIDHTAFSIEDRNKKRSLALFKEAMKISRSNRARFYVPDMQLLLGQLKELHSQPREALEWYLRSLKLTRKSGDMVNSIKGHSLISCLFHREKPPLLLSAASTHMKQASETSKATGLILVEMLRAEEAIAMACLRVDKKAKAEGLLSHAIAHWEKISNKYEVERLNAVKIRIGP